MNTSKFARYLPFGIVLSAFAVGCTNTATVEPGHLGLLFDPKNGGLQRDALKPGFYRFPTKARIEDYDVTYSSRKEEIKTASSEGLELTLHVAVRYRPIASELYLLATEIGDDEHYYEEVIGPEFRSAARGVFARHSYMELQRKDEHIEDEVEEELKRRTARKHIEISAVTLESISYAPEIAQAVKAKLVGEQEAARKKAALENEALQNKLELERKSEQERLQAEATLRQKELDRKLAEEQAQIDKTTAEGESVAGVMRAKAQAEEMKIMAKAQAEEHKAENTAVTPLAVQMAAYEALGKLGGNGTTIYLGDWSHAPSFLFPPAMAAMPQANRAAGYAPTNAASPVKPGPYKAMKATVTGAGPGATPTVVLPASTPPTPAVVVPGAAATPSVVLPARTPVVTTNWGIE